MAHFSWKNKKVFVTGAGGFIGSHLCECLVKLGAKVKAMAEYNSLGRWGWLDYSSLHDEMDIFLGDIRDRDSTREAVKGQDMVFHLAALIGIPYSYIAPASYIETNIAGTLNLLQAAREYDIECFLQTSTSETYGTAQYTPIDEKHQLQGQSPYSASKIGADKMAESFYRSFKVPVVTVRPFNTYGPRQSARAVIPTIITQILEKDKVCIGSLAPRRDLTYVQDIALAFIGAAQAGKSAFGEVFNVGSGKSISIGELAQVIAKLIGKEVPVESSCQRIRPEASEVMLLMADSSKAKKIFGWEPSLSLEEGLKKTIEWFKDKDNLKLYKNDRYVV
ncbi:MAG: SDR family NAD(P)-dependent oxidoreductase [Candidatus Omnitrophica bacterium]|nr:SDR family NAD(P)-dependent oxidoreductase [Candidatus Omnitrophota bacterium]